MANRSTGTQRIEAPSLAKATRSSFETEEIGVASKQTEYELEVQVGYILRQANQRHTAIFASHFGDVTPPQWAALAKLHDVGPCSQNHLGRLTAMDVATIKGVVDRLGRRGYIRTVADATDRRRVNIELTVDGQNFYKSHRRAAFQVSVETLAGLTPHQRETFLILLRKMT